MLAIIFRDCRKCPSDTLAHQHYGIQRRNSTFDFGRKPSSPGNTLQPMRSRPNAGRLRKAPPHGIEPEAKGWSN